MVFTIQMKPLQQYVVLTFESMDEIQWCYHSNETSLVVLSHGAIYFEAFYKLKFGYFVHFQPFLGVKGLKRKTNMFLRLSTKNRENG